MISLDQFAQTCDNHILIPISTSWSFNAQYAKMVWLGPLEKVEILRIRPFVLRWFQCYNDIKSADYSRLTRCLNGFLSDADVLKLHYIDFPQPFLGLYGGSV